MARRRKTIARRRPKEQKTMARRSRVRTIYRKARSVHRRASGGWGGMFGKLKPLLAGAIGGIAYGFGKNVHDTYGGPAALAGVGYFMGNETLMTLSGIELAQGFGAQTGTAGGYL